MLILTPRSIARMFFFVHPFFALPVLLREAVILCDGVILSAAKNDRQRADFPFADQRFFAALRMTGNAQHDSLWRLGGVAM